jgi:hypothetical protein
MKFIKGYRIISLPFPPSPIQNDLSKQAFHHLFVKEHFDNQNKANSGKILFVGNISYFAGSVLSYENLHDYLKLFFERYGEIDTVSLSEEDDNSRSAASHTRFAHIHFVKKSTVKYILSTVTDNEFGQLIKSEILPFLEQYRPKNVVGNGNIAKMKENIRELFPLYDIDEKEFEENINQFMLEFNEKESNDLFNRNEMKNQPDDDGFITVVSRYVVRRFFFVLSLPASLVVLFSPLCFFLSLFLPRLIRSKRKHDEMLKESTTSSAFNDKGRQKRSHKKNKSSDLKNFYQFQMKEEKMKQLDIMRNRFQENKDKIQKMKEQRKFNPF